MCRANSGQQKFKILLSNCYYDVAQVILTDLIAKMA